MSIQRALGNVGEIVNDIRQAVIAETGCTPELATKAVFDRGDQVILSLEHGIDGLGDTWSGRHLDILVAIANRMQYPGFFEDETPGATCWQDER